MYAIVEIAGQQFKVEKNQQIFVHRLETKEGGKVTFDNVLLVDNDGKVEVGAPTVNGIKVTAKVLEHLKGEKVIVFKKKRRKGYQKSNGHRQYLSKIEIQEIGKIGKEVVEQEEASIAKKPVAKKATAKAKKEE